MAMAASDSPIEVVVRFSTSNTDVIVSIANPSAATALTLKQQIRSHLDEPAASSRLRLIHAGKVLPDTEALSRTLHATYPPPSASGKGKGKQRLRDPAARVYVHCSVGDPLSPEDLAAETNSAQDADNALISSLKPVVATINTTDSGQENSTTPAPRGFDRLLSAGFTPGEITTLRTQFLAIQSQTHTPENMPTGPALLALEERWLDNTHSPSSGDGENDAEDAAGLDDMLWGNLIGFFWPIGAMLCGWREEGVWTKRRKIAVLSGVLVNLTFGVLRVMN